MFLQSVLFVQQIHASKPAVRQARGSKVKFQGKERVNPGSCRRSSARPVRLSVDGRALRSLLRCCLGDRPTSSAVPLTDDNRRTRLRRIYRVGAPSERPFYASAAAYSATRLAGARLQQLLKFPTYKLSSRAI